jgi:hypothetical protein
LNLKSLKKNQRPSQNLSLPLNLCLSPSLSQQSPHLPSPHLPSPLQLKLLSPSPLQPSLPQLNPLPHPSLLLLPNLPRPSPLFLHLNQLLPLLSQNLSLPRPPSQINQC